MHLLAVPRAHPGNVQVFILFTRPFSYRGAQYQAVTPLEIDTHGVSCTRKHTLMATYATLQPQYVGTLSMIMSCASLVKSPPLPSLFSSFSPSLPRPVFINLSLHLPLLHKIESHSLILKSQVAHVLLNT